MHRAEPKTLFEWACGLNPNPFKGGKPPRRVPTADILADEDALQERAKKIEDRRRGIDSLIN